MVNKLMAWFRSKNLNSHVIGGLIIGGATLIMTDKQVQDFVLSLFVQHPKIGTLIVSLAGIIFKFSHSSSAAGTVATSKAILASPQAPTSAQVDAATTK